MALCAVSISRLRCCRLDCELPGSSEPSPKRSVALEQPADFSPVRVGGLPNRGIAGFDDAAGPHSFLRPGLELRLCDRSARIWLLHPDINAGNSPMRGERNESQQNEFVMAIHPPPPHADRILM